MCLYTYAIYNRCHCRSFIIYISRIYLIVIIRTLIFLFSIIIFHNFFSLQLPEHIVEDLSDGSGIPEIVGELDQFSVHLDTEDDLCLENLKVSSSGNYVILFCLLVISEIAV